MGKRTKARLFCWVFFHCAEILCAALDAFCKLCRSFFTLTLHIMAHLTYFGVENFKRFEKFEMENIGQFNLMWGDNNVGKTSVLEALLFHPEPHIFKHRLLTVLFSFRNFSDITRSYWTYFANRKNLPLLVGEVKFVYEGVETGHTIESIFFREGTKAVNWNRINSHDDYDGDYKNILKSIIPFEQDNAADIERVRRLITKRADTTVLSEQDNAADNNEEFFQDNKFIPRFDGTFTFGDNIKFDGTFYPHPQMPYIPFFLGYEHNLTRKFTRYIQRSESLTDAFTRGLRCMIPGAKGIIVETEETSPQNPILLIRQEGNDVAMPLGTFGDGAIKLFRILVEIIVHKGERLMIDEIDSGVHVSRFHDFLRAILLAAQEHKVQIFATTHNYECLKFFKEVLEEKEMQELQANARGIKLIATPSGETKALTYTFEEFRYSFETMNDPRVVFRFAEDVR